MATAIAAVIDGCELQETYDSLLKLSLRANMPGMESTMRRLAPMYAVARRPMRDR